MKVSLSILDMKACDKTGNTVVVSESGVEGESEGDRGREGWQFTLTVQVNGEACYGTYSGYM